MCEWGKTIDVRVWIFPELSRTGKLAWEYKPIDSCIAQIVAALNDAGVYTTGSCCGHGWEPGSILLRDGRILKIERAA